MNKQLVAKSLVILEVFRAQIDKTGSNKDEKIGPTGSVLGKNEILRATGSRDKPMIFRTIDFLKKAKIIDSKKFKKGKKGDVFLSPLGNEIVDLVIDIHSCSDAHRAVETKISEYLPLIEDEFSPMQSAEEYDRHYPSKKLRERLMKKGWKNEELDSFDEVIQSLYEISDIYRKNILNSLLHRYSTIMSRFQVNKDARAVLTKLILNEISNILNSSLVLNKMEPSFSDAYHFRFGNLEIPILKDIEHTFKNPLRVISNSLTSNEITQLTSSLFCVLKPSEGEFFNFVEVYPDIEWMKKRIEDIRASEEDKSSEEHAKCYLYNLEELYRSRMISTRRYKELMWEGEELMHEDDESTPASKLDK